MDRRIAADDERSLTVGRLAAGSNDTRSPWNADEKMPGADIIRFPLDRRRAIGCPQCGTYSDAKQVGRLTWAWCDRHAVRWVIADRPTPPTVDRVQLRRMVEFLAGYTEVSAG